MSDKSPPRQIGDMAHSITVTGHVFPWMDEQPVLVAMPGTNDMFLPVFSTDDKLRAMMGRSQIPFGSIKQIDDQADFLASLPLRLSSGNRLRIAVDAYWTPKGTVRFAEIIRSA